MIYGYIRVSTDKQTTENQRFEIENFAGTRNIRIERWIEETISGTTQLSKRKLGGLMRRIRAGDMVIVSELSRLGRNLLQIMGILHHCMNVGATIRTIKDNYELSDDIASKTLAFAFGLSAEIERNLISSRTREAMARLRAGGKKLGRPLGSGNKRLKLAPHKDAIAQLRLKGWKKAKIARKFKVSRMTVINFLKRLAL
jgi:DNA invertase Pin-like site-specific DNA recombinase